MMVALSNDPPFVRPKPKHGTRAKYVQGCHCPRCTKANRDYQREYMRERRKLGIVFHNGERVTK